VLEPINITMLRGYWRVVDTRFSGRRVRM